MAKQIYCFTFIFTTLAAQVLAVCTSDITQSHSTNASGSITLNGFAPPGETASLYLLSVQVQNYLNISTNQSDTTRQLSLRTEPAQNLSSPSLSWAGCSLIYKLRVPGKAQSTVQSPSTNTCNGHISTACQQALNAAALASAQQLAGNFSRHDEADNEETEFPNSCQLTLQDATLIQNVPACGIITEPYYSATGYSLSDFGSTEKKIIRALNPDSDNTTCPDDIGNGGNEDSNFFFASVDVAGIVAPEEDFVPNDPYSLGVASDPVGSYGNYDELITDVLAVMMIGFSKNDTSFADTRLTCVSVDTYEQGSRGFPTGLPTPSAGNGLGSVHRDAFWVGVGAALVSLASL